MGDGIKVLELQAKIDAVAKQIQRVEANSKAVESAIVTKGTFRGYRGEDLFLKHNLGTVQEEMTKQLLRKWKGLGFRRKELLAHSGQTESAIGAPDGVLRAPEAPLSPAPSFGVAASSRDSENGCDPVNSTNGDTSNGCKAANGGSTSGSTRDAVKSGDPANSGGTGGGGGKTDGGDSSTITITTEAARALSPPRERPSPPRIACPATPSTPNHFKWPPSPIEVSPSLATPARSSSATLSVDAISPAPETPTLANDAVASRLVSGTPNDDVAAIATGELTTAKTIPHEESSPRGAVDPRRDDVSYSRSVVFASPVRGKRILVPPAPAEKDAGKSTTPKKTKRRDSSNNAVAPRPLKSSRRGHAERPGPAHSVEEYLANTQRGREAVASISVGTAFWIKFSDTKEAWLECGVVKKVHQKSAVPYEVEWRPYDSSGCDLALNPKKRVALTPRLFVGKPDDFEPTVEGDPPAGTAPRGEFKVTTKKHLLTVPPIGSWCIVKDDQPWGSLGPFAF